MGLRSSLLFSCLFILFSTFQSFNSILIIRKEVFRNPDHRIVTSKTARRSSQTWRKRGPSHSWWRPPGLPCRPGPRSEWRPGRCWTPAGDRPDCKYIWIHLCLRSFPEKPKMFVLNPQKAKKLGQGSPLFSLWLYSMTRLCSLGWLSLRTHPSCFTN